MPQIYTLRVVNETDETVTICVYQTEPESSLDDAVSLAWFVARLWIAPTRLRRLWTAARS